MPIGLATVLKLLWPILVAELCILAFKWLALPIQSPIDYLLLIASIAALPFIAGWRLSKAALPRWMCVLSGLTVTALNLLWAAAAVILGHSDWLAFLGFVLASMIFAVGPQLLFAFAGAQYGKYQLRSTT